MLDNHSRDFLFEDVPGDIHSESVQVSDIHRRLDVVLLSRQNAISDQVQTHSEPMEPATDRRLSALAYCRICPDQQQHHMTTVEARPNLGTGD